MAETKAKTITAWVRDLLVDWLPAHGYELWNIEFIKSGQERNLNVYIDRLPEPITLSHGDEVIDANADSPVAKGIGTDDCETVSKYLSERLDEEDVIDGNYYLIVSSPGMDRILFTDEHFKRYEGSAVDVSLYKGVDGCKAYAGILESRSDASLNIISDIDGREISLPRELVSKVRLQVRF